MSFCLVVYVMALGTDRADGVLRTLRRRAREINTLPRNAVQPTVRPGGSDTTWPGAELQKNTPSPPSFRRPSTSSQRPTDRSRPTRTDQGKVGFMWWPWGHGGQGERQGQVAPPQQAPVAAVSSTTSSSDSPATRHNSNQTSAPPADLKRPPLLGLGAACFFLAFAGATIYGFRAAKKAELKEAADLANKTFAQGANSSSSSLASAPSALTRGPTAAAGQSHANARATTTSTTMDWGSPAGSSAPSVLSKSAAGGRSTTPSRFAVPLPKMQDGKPVFEESPALTAIKAFGIATALVGVVSVASIEVGRRVWQIEDVSEWTESIGTARVLQTTDLTLHCPPWKFPPSNRCTT